MNIEIKTCKAMVHNDYGVSFHRCNRKAVVGDYCKIHNPEYKKQKDLERSARWDKEREERNKKWKLENAAISMLTVLKETNDILTEMGWHTDRGLLQRIREVISFAEYKPQ